MFTDTITKEFDNKNELHYIYTDLSKAFNKVNLKHKLCSNDIGGNLLNRSTIYLQNRQQRVTLNDTTSGWRDVTSGVHQGSILEPKLCLMFAMAVSFLHPFEIWLNVIRC